MLSHSPPPRDPHNPPPEEDSDYYDVSLPLELSPITEWLLTFLPLALTPDSASDLDGESIPLTPLPTEALRTVLPLAMTSYSASDLDGESIFLQHLSEDSYASSGSDSETEDDAVMVNSELFSTKNLPEVFDFSWSDSETEPSALSGVELPFFFD